MIRCLHLRTKILFVTGVTVLLLTILLASPLWADVEEQDPETEPAESVVETHRHASLYSGYRFVTPDGMTAAADPYSRSRSGVVGGLSLGTLGPDLKLTVDGTFLHTDDYRAELFFDYKGMARFHSESQTFWHNLLSEVLPPDSPPNYVTRQPDTGTVYGIRTFINQVDTRLKLGNNPFHLNLGYWELKRDGSEQVRFSDHYFGILTNSIRTDNRPVNRYTREGSAGLDGHFGAFDLTYGFRIRDFVDNAETPRFPFSANSGDRYSVIPDSRVTSHTVKLFSDLSGGLVGSASYNLTQRENTGGQGDAIPAERPSDTIHSVAADLTYTPSKRHSFAIKYRHREIDRTTPATLFYPYPQITAPPAGILTGTPGVLNVRPAPSSTRDTVTFSATFRPAPKVIYRLEYNAELESRTNVLDQQATAGSLTALHSDSRQTHTGTAAFYWRPLNGIKVNASYSYAASDLQAYRASFSDRHVGKLIATYTRNGRWGATGSYLIQYDSGESSAFTTTVPSPATYTMPRKNHSESCNTSVWFSPADRLTITASYSYLETETDQSLLIASQINDANPLIASSYRSSAHVYGIDAVYAATESLDLSLAFQQVRSRSHFDLPERNLDISGQPFGYYSTTGITGLSSLDTTETGVSARGDWRFSATLSCALDYSYRNYNSGNSLYDGSVHATMLTLKGRW